MKSRTSQIIVENLVTEMQCGQLLAENIADELVSLLVNIPSLGGIRRMRE